MADAYGIDYPPALTSRHTRGRAIDMSISWNGTLSINNRDDDPIDIVSAPRNGRNTDLHMVGATYGVYKLVRDPPHWSDDGR